MDEPKKSAQALREEEILAFWQAEKIFEQSLAKASPKGEFVFYDGPPFATGLPHYGHILPGTIKDVIPRYKTMQGFHVRRRWGWDCHGLPLENLIEKELNLNHKKEIEAYGIGNFNEQARTSVLRFADDWKKIVPRLGRFVDMEDDYRSLDVSYSETVWWIFKTLYDRGLIYEGYKSMQICPRCETTLANFEVNQGYKDVTDISVYVKFKIEKSKIKITDQNLKIDDNTYLIAWTTTPWTLPGNVALAVNPDADYVVVPSNIQFGHAEIIGQDSHSIATRGSLVLLKDIFWKNMASNAGLKEPLLLLFRDLDKLKEDIKKFSSDFNGFAKEYNIQIIKGSDLIGLSYEPLFDYYSKPDEKELQRRSALSPRESASWDNGWKVYGADFVSTEDGTGIVHIAPAFGEDDLKLGQANNLPFIQHVKMDGTFKPEVTDLAGQSAKLIENSQAADIEVIKLLAAKGALLAKEKIVHSYPHCWRCDTPLLNYATSSWFVKVTDFKDKLITTNQGITWVPEHIKDGRFGKWLEGARDWAISRSRFWGAPLPVWRCVECQELAVMGSLADLQALNKPAKNFYQVMRHGQTASNLSNKISFKAEAEDGLTEIGQTEITQASELLAEQGIDLIISSPFRRARESAELVAKSLGLDASKIIVDPRLQEADPGNLDGSTWAGYRVSVQANDASGRESLSAIRARVMSLLFDLEQKYTNQNILIVSHGLPLRILLLASEGIANRNLRTDTRWDELTMTNAEIKTLNFKPYPHNLDFDLDFHRPYIDEVKLPCACGGQMVRVPEVFDCWFESGAMPYAQDHYPFNNSKSLIDPEKGLGFPADFIAEGLDQTRGWFYSLLVLGVALFGQSPYKNVIVNGMVLAEDGQKMSKRLKNYPDPLMVVDKYGADALRLYLLLAPIMRGEDLNLTEKGIGEVSRRILARLDNVLTFFLTYGDLSSSIALPASTNILDRWLSDRLDETINLVSDNLNRYELDKATRALDDFIDDLSNWYVRRSRDRFRSDDVADRTQVNATLRYVLLELSKLLAPFAPFAADHLYRSLGDTNKLVSVHLASWPTAGSANPDLIALMTELRHLSTLGLELRAKAGIKVRQPLAKISIQSETLAGQTDLLEILADELNVKTIAFDSALTAPAELDLNISPELKAEGLARDLMRLLQEGRKQAGFLPADLADLEIYLSEELVTVWQQFETEIKKVAKLQQVKIVDQAVGETTKLDQAELAFKLERAS